MPNNLLGDYKTLLSNGARFIGSFTYGDTITQHIEVGDYFVVHST